MPGYLDSNSGLYFGWDEGEDGWGTPTNRSLRQLAYGGLTRSVKGTVSSPPSTPTLGDKYIVGANPTGWGLTPAPLEHQIVVYGRELATPTNISWLVFQPRVGNEVFDESRGIRVQYYEGSWQEIRPSQNQPILSDNTISGDGVTTPQSVQFPDQLQSDWAITDTNDARFIRNKPTIPRAIETVFWQTGSFNISSSVSGTRYLTLPGSVALSAQAVYAHNFGLIYAGPNPELKLGFGCRITATGFNPSNRIRIENNQNERSGYGNSTSPNSSRIDLWTESRQHTYTLRLRVNGSDTGFRLSGNWYAGLLISN